MYVFNKKKLAEMVIAKRLKENIYMKDVAKVAKVSVASVSRIESGENCRAHILAGICTWLGKEPGFFFDKTKPKTKTSKK